MSRKRSRFGIGPIWTILSILFTIFILKINQQYLSGMKIPHISGLELKVAGMIIIIPGIIIFIKSIIDFNTAYKVNRLVTSGVYSIFRHPLYASIILFIVPGMVLILQYVLVITVPIVMYILCRLLLPIEERKLKKSFGNEYLEYKKRVNAIFPKII